MGGREPRPDPAFDLEAHVEPEDTRGFEQRVPRCTDIQQGSEQHVAREPADRIDVGDARHEARTSARRAILAATDPAPRPSSMPTTARPSAQDTSIAFSAVWPPCA